MQFKNLELELTYPNGHEKEGQPLDKICIIGQSGTGKTNLLNIIKKSVMDFSKLPTNIYSFRLDKKYRAIFIYVGENTIETAVISKKPHCLEL